jgi:Xaa-Pro dipeptidase
MQAANGTITRPTVRVVVKRIIHSQCQSSVVTRSMPVGNGGKFTPETRAIYELVLEMQTVHFHRAGVLEANTDLFKTSLEALKPGLHWDAVQLLCHRILVRGFQKLGIFRADAEEAAVLASGVSAAFFPHGVGHSLGLDVHDVPSASKPTLNPTVVRDRADLGHEKLYDYLRLRLPLESGMVVVRLLHCRFICWRALCIRWLTSMWMGTDGGAGDILPSALARWGA